MQANYKNLAKYCKPKSGTVYIYICICTYIYTLHTCTCTCTCTQAHIHTHTHIQYIEDEKGNTYLPQKLWKIKNNMHLILFLPLFLLAK